MADILIGTQTTNTNGVASFASLPPGNYRYVQTTAKAGYTVDSTPHTFSVSSATPVSQTQENTPTAVGSLTVTKHVAGNPSLLLSGATFTLQDSTGKTMQSVSAPSAANGTIVFNNLMSISGTPQEYRVTEVTPPTNYDLNTTTYPVNVTVSQNADQAVPNTPTVQGALNVTLEDTNYNEYTLQGAQYELYWVDGN